MMQPDRIDKTLPTNIPLLFKHRAEQYPSLTAQASKNSEGKFISKSFSEVYLQILQFANSLQKIGVKRGENVALISDNRQEWLVSDLALLSIGAVDIPRGKDSIASEIRYIINFSECKTGIFENETQLRKALEKKDEIPELCKVILFDKPNPKTEEEKITALNLFSEALGVKIFYYSDLFSDEKYSLTDNDKDRIEKEMQLTSPNDLATIIFTSGTTGVPKGVMLTHRNYMAQLEVVHTVLTVKPGDMWLSVLPVWHSFERIMQYIAFTLASGIAYSKPVAAVMLPDLIKIKPQWMCGVPRLWEALARGVYQSMKKTGGVKLFLFNFFILIGTQFAWAKDSVSGMTCHFKKYPRIFDFLTGVIPFILLYPVYKLGNKLVYSKIRNMLGGKIIGAISGGGALQKKTDNFYRAIGLNLLEGYGITEAGPVLSVRNCKKPRPNCVGEIYPSVEVKIMSEKNGEPEFNKKLKNGEVGLVFARGEQIMKGYYKQPELTASVLVDGWLNTGDLGFLSTDNEIKITGRAKDTIVLLDGENIEPFAIESAICSSDFVDFTVVLGQDKKFLGALIVPNKEAIIQYANSNQITYSLYEELLRTLEIKKLIRSEIDKKVCSATGYRYCERVNKFILLPNTFVIGKELSVKQELVRFKISKIYKEEINQLFL